MNDIAGVIFDKDGTLFNFAASWGNWAAALVQDLAPDDADRATRLAGAIGYDLAERRFSPDSPVIAGTPDEIAQCLLPELPGQSLQALVARMNGLAAQAQMAEAVPLQPLIGQLKARGLRLGLATNDGEAPARAHLASVGVLDQFDFVAGFDSGHGGKPEPGMLLAFARAFALPVGQVVMVGDSAHDMAAGRAAGMVTVAVLTGLADAQDLNPMADVVLPDIGHLPAWLEGRASARHN